MSDIPAIYAFIGLGLLLVLTIIAVLLWKFTKLFSAFLKLFGTYVHYVITFLGWLKKALLRFWKWLQFWKSDKRPNT